MKKLNGRGLSLVARFLFMAVAAVFAVASASAADTLYLRAVNGDWDASASDQYKMTLVKDEGDLQVYNWTGKIPSSFVIASDAYSVCLGRSVDIDVNSKTTSELFSFDANDDSSLIKLTGSKRVYPEMIVVTKKGNSWDIKPVLALEIAILDAETPYNPAMIASCIEDKVIYEWDGIFYTNEENFKINTRSGTAVCNNSPSGGIVLNTEFRINLITNKYIMCTVTDVPLHFTITYDESQGTYSLLAEEIVEEKELAYCLLQEDGSIWQLEADESVYSLTTDFAFGGFVVAEYDRAIENPSYSDLTGYYTNRGGVSYYYDELLSKIKGMPENQEDVAFMTLADLPDAEREMTFKFNPEKSTLRVDGDTECVHIPIYFFNGNLKHGEEARFEKPHIRVENTSGKYYTDPQGSAMYQHEVNLYDADPSFWRFDLWIPENELNLAKNGADGPSKAVAPYAASQLFITPNRASTIGSSNLHLTFTDGKGTSDPQFAKAPILKAGVYSLNEDDYFVSPLNNIYMIIEVGGGKSAIVLPQSTDGQYLFTGTIGPGLMTENSPELSFYIATKVDNNNQPEGTVYGAPEDVTTDVISADLNSAITHNNYEGTMVRGSDNPWVIDYNQLPADRKDQDIAFSIEIGPDNAPTISFGYSANDFQTVVEENVGTDDEIIWFNLQGVRLSAPAPGLNIMVRGSKAQKVLI
ncbi:MAG: hypothetical protein HDS67_03290 [Bacteroidales bacterium]|nr:hypothetical protein [Bacteroidales bacterium]